MAEEANDNVDGLATQASNSQRKARLSDSSVMGTVSTKVCCVCGVDLQGRMRYKDSGGRYWCPACNEKDQLSREPASCPDCNAALTRADLLEFKGTAVCQACWEKRRQSARREESRIRAIEEEVREQQERKKRISMIAMGFVLLVVIWSAAMFAFWLLAKK